MIIVLEGIQLQLSGWTRNPFRLYLGLGAAASRTGSGKELELL